MYVKTDGIVLKETEYKDNDKLLTVLTRDLGRITVKARGVKSGKSGSKAACQLLAYSEFTLFEQQGRYTVREAVSKELFPELQKDLELLALASYFAQVTLTVAQEDDPVPELLSLLLNALYAVRKRLAGKQNLPAFMVFNDATLREMAEKKPMSIDELLNISGVGEKKAARYGNAFLRVIEDAVGSRE